MEQARGGVLAVTCVMVVSLSLSCAGAQQAAVPRALCWLQRGPGGCTAVFQSLLSKGFTGVGGFGMALKGSLPLPVL